MIKSSAQGAQCQSFLKFEHSGPLHPNGHNSVTPTSRVNRGSPQRKTARPPMKQNRQATRPKHSLQIAGCFE
jgi:hypothetical protein